MIDWNDRYSDWRYALAEALNHSCGTNHPEVESFIASVADEIASDDGSNDGPNWLAVFRLHDGRFALLNAGCDYTGWDCRAGGEVSCADSLPELCRMHMDDDIRQRLGFDVFGERVEPAP